MHTQEADLRRMTANGRFASFDSQIIASQGRLLMPTELPIELLTSRRQKLVEVSHDSRIGIVDV